MIKKLTKAVVDRMQPGEIIWDSDVKGFGARHQGGRPCYMFKTRIHGRQRYVSIGKHGSPWTVDTARREALRLLTGARQGEDLARTQKDKRLSTSLRKIADHYFRDYGPKLKQATLIQYVAMFDNDILPVFGSRCLIDIAKREVETLHSRLAKTPRKANHVVVVLSSCISWALKQGYAPQGMPNPCHGIKMFREQKRERYLTTEEIKRLFETLDAVEKDGTCSDSITAAIRLLLLTGARHGEITTLKWEYVDFERAILWLPDSETGRKAIHLDDEALEILRTHPRRPGNPYVIAGRCHGNYLTNLQKPWDLIRTRAGLPGVRIHDLRHSWASLAINAGASLHMIGKLLGHSQPQTTARYAHLAENPLKEVTRGGGAAVAATLNLVVRR
jgi:integrase